MPPDRQQEICRKVELTLDTPLPAAQLADLSQSHRHLSSGAWPRPAGAVTEELGQRITGTAASRTCVASHGSSARPFSISAANRARPVRFIRSARATWARRPVARAPWNSGVRTGLFHEAIGTIGGRSKCRSTWARLPSRSASSISKSSTNTRAALQPPSPFADCHVPLPARWRPASPAEPPARQRIPQVPISPSNRPWRTASKILRSAGPDVAARFAAI